MSEEGEAVDAMSLPRETLPLQGAVERAAQMAGLPQALQRAVIAGDLTYLGPDDRVKFYAAVCESLGLNPLTKPFLYIELNRKLTLYASKDCTDQLRKIHGVSVTKMETKYDADVFVVTAYGCDRDRRTDVSTGAVTLGRLTGEARANAIMKAETKAKRRLTLSLCGLGMLDETEVGSIPDVKLVDPDTLPAAVVAPASGGAAQTTPLVEPDESSSEGHPERQDSGSVPAAPPPAPTPFAALMERRAKLPPDVQALVPTEEDMHAIPPPDLLQAVPSYIESIRRMAEERKLSPKERGDLLEQFFGNRRARLSDNLNPFFLYALYHHMDPR